MQKKGKKNGCRSIIKVEKAIIFYPKYILKILVWRSNLENNLKKWKKIRKDYETTETSYRKLSKIYGFHEKSIQRRSKKDGWIKYSKGIQQVNDLAKKMFILRSKTTIEDLIKQEDEILAKYQEVIDGDSEIAEIFKQVQDLENLNPDKKGNYNLEIKMTGSVKQLVEAMMLIGDKRRELRGVLPLKDAKTLSLKEEELKHKIKAQELELKRQELIILEKQIDLRIKEIENRRLLK